MNKIKNIHLMKNWPAIVLLTVIAFSAACGTRVGDIILGECTQCGLNSGEEIYDQGTGNVYVVPDSGCITVPGDCSKHNFVPLLGVQS